MPNKRMLPIKVEVDIASHEAAPVIAAASSGDHSEPDISESKHFHASFLCLIGAQIPSRLHAGPL